MKKGGNLLLFPEGAFNVSPNALVCPFFAGAVDLAITCGAEIVPLAIARNGKTYYGKIGKNINYEGYSYEDRFHLTDELRDHVATLKWEIIENLPHLSRVKLRSDAHDTYLREILSTGTNYTYTVEDILSTQYHPKSIIAPRDAFAHLRMLKPSKENAFLFNERLNGESQPV